MSLRTSNWSGVLRVGAAAAVVLAVALPWIRARAGGAVALPPPTVDMARDARAGKQTVVFAGGCFWGVQAVFQHVKGVMSATSGYAGGDERRATYELVSAGDTGHAESVQVTFDPAQISYGQLLQVFFSVAHDPTELNRQGPDDGTQYRSAIFFTDAEQATSPRRTSRSSTRQVFPRPIVTEWPRCRRVLPGRGLPPGLRDPSSERSVHRDQRRAEGRTPAPDVSRPLSLAGQAIAHVGCRLPAAPKHVRQGPENGGGRRPTPRRRAIAHRDVSDEGRAENDGEAGVDPLLESRRHRREQQHEPKELRPRELDPEVGGKAEVGERRRHLRQAELA